MQPDGNILYLSRQDVECACREIDPVAAVHESLTLHGRRATVLPAEAYLRWTTAGGSSARSLCMPAYVGGQVVTAGTKIINASLGNGKRGLPRASGLLVLFDTETARTYCVMEASHISAARTASVTLLAAEHLGAHPLSSVALLGAGTLAEAHLDLFLDRLPRLGQVAIFDIDEERARGLARKFAGRLHRQGVVLTIVDSPEEAVAAQLVVPVTTATEGYIGFDWLRPGSLVVNVSLDDLLTDVILRAELVVVDDWNLVRDDPYRLLGRMHRKGLLHGPKDPAPAGNGVRSRQVDCELSDILIGTHPGRREPTDTIVVNPFGLAIEDVVLGSYVYDVAVQRGLGIRLPA